nr:FAD-dependent oxidoreductase [Rhodocyclus gracilis]
MVGQGANAPARSAPRSGQPRAGRLPAVVSVGSPPSEATENTCPVDVLVIGGGVAGLCAALEAAAAGACVHLLEAAPRPLRGGNARHSRNLRQANVHETPWQRDHYPVADFRAELLAATGHSSSVGSCGDIEDSASTASLVDTLVAGSSELADWLMAHGVALQPTAGGLIPWSRKTVFFLGGGKAMVNALYAAADTAGIHVTYDCRVPSLPLEPARPTTSPAASGPMSEREESATCAPGAPDARFAIIAETPRGPRRFSARAVVVASGGYPANRDWLAERWGDAARHFANRGSPYLRGELLHALLAQGAQPVGVAGDCHLVAVDARAPQDDAGIVSRVDGMPLGIVVDRDGQRVCDEGEDIGPIRFSHWGQRLAHLPGQLAWLLLDADGLAALPALLCPPVMAPTLEALAARTGIDGDALIRTVATFNDALAAARANGDEGATPPGQPSRRVHDKPPIRPLLRAPFAAIPMQPGVSFTCFGVAVDGAARLRRDDGSVCSALFAAGMIMAPAILGSAYLSGAALTISAVFGRIAGRNAAAVALSRPNAPATLPAGATAPAPLPGNSPP